MSHARAVELAEQLNAAGVRAVTSARSVVTPCVLITPPVRTFDLACGYTARWSLFVLSGGGGDEASWVALDELTDQLLAALDDPPETVTPTSWKADPGAEALAAFRVDFDEAVD